jgi:hypothetical protein
VPAGCKKLLLGVAVQHYLARIRNGISVWVWIAKESLLDDHLGPGPTIVLGDTLVVHAKSQTQLARKGNGYLCISRSLSHRFGSAEGLALSKYGQIKTAW